MSVEAVEPMGCGDGGLEKRESCVPCRLATKPLSADQVRVRRTELPDEWFLDDDATRLKRRYKTRDFAQSLDWVNRIGAVAEELDHHPDIAFGWGWLEVTLWTHKVNGLTDGDFLLARRIDSALKDQNTVL